MNLTRDKKIQLIKTNILPAALYGCETGNPSIQAMKKLRSSIADIIGAASAKRSVNLTFDTAGVNEDLDPITNMFYYRVAELRRTSAKHKGKLGMVKLILKRHAHRQQAAKDKGQIQEPYDITRWYTQEDDEDYIPDEVVGPVTLLLSDLESLGCTMGQDLIIRQKDEPDIDIWNMPWQHLKTAITKIPSRQRAKATDATRTFAGEISEIDHEVMKGLLNKMGEKEARVYRYVSTGAMWNENQLHSIDKGDGKCRHCKAYVEDTEHILWKCPVIHKYRKNKELCEVNTDCIPKCVKNGIPIVIGCDLTCDFWGTKHGNDVNDNTKFAIGQPISKTKKFQEAKQKTSRNALLTKRLK